jgi:hypothetical protein
MYFGIIGQITDVETIAKGTSVRERRRLRKQFGPGRWRKLKGVATVSRKVELHWYEAHGVGRKKLKIKRYLD